MHQCVPVHVGEGLETLPEQDPPPIFHHRHPVRTAALSERCEVAAPVGRSHHVQAPDVLEYLYAFCYVRVAPERPHRVHLLLELHHEVRRGLLLGVALHYHVLARAIRGERRDTLSPPRELPNDAVTRLREGLVRDGDVGMASTHPAEFYEVRLHQLVSLVRRQRTIPVEVEAVERVREVVRRSGRGVESALEHLLEPHKAVQVHAPAASALREARVTLLPEAAVVLEQLGHPGDHHLVIRGVVESRQCWQRRPRCILARGLLGCRRNRWPSSRFEHSRGRRHKPWPHRRLMREPLRDRWRPDRHGVRRRDSLQRRRRW
mmetsp:Transcript_113070/g.319975  ORF Transcript_113070/g.319975 Transcript_113070/m.319975 type:complete len:319 (-) Transcript_113070:66-1022(-)